MKTQNNTHNSTNKIANFDNTKHLDWFEALDEMGPKFVTKSNLSNKHFSKSFDELSELEIFKLYRTYASTYCQKKNIEFLPDTSLHHSELNYKQIDDICQFLGHRRDDIPESYWQRQWYLIKKYGKSFGKESLERHISFMEAKKLNSPTLSSEYNEFVSKKPEQKEFSNLLSQLKDKFKK